MLQRSLYKLSLYWIHTNNVRANRLLPNSITNEQAIELIEPYFIKKQEIVSNNNHYKRQLLNDAFNVYNHIDDKQIHSIAIMLKLCLHLKQAQQSSILLPDIQIKQSLTLYLLYLKCCVQCKHIDINKTIQILELISASSQSLTKKRELKDYSIAINKIITNIGPNKSILNRISSLIDNIGISDIFIKSGLIIAYDKCMDVENALNVFNSIHKSEMNVIIIGNILNVLVKHEMYDTALSIYDEYEQLHDDISHCIAIKACTKIGDLEKGKYIHSNIKNASKKGSGIYSLLINFYGKCGDIDTVYKLFESICDDDKDIELINTMMSVCMLNDNYERCLQLYDQLGDKANNVSHVLAIKCSGYVKLQTGKEIHDKFSEEDICIDINIHKALIEFYGRFHDISEAENVYNLVGKNNNLTTETVNTLMNVYNNHDMNKECMNLFKNMTVDKDITSYKNVLVACVNGAALFYGKQIHQTLKTDNKLNWMLTNTSILTNLIEMYGRCGMIHYAEDIFNDIKTNQYHKYCNNISIWKSMMMAYSKLGDLNKAMDLYHLMKLQANIQPNTSIFIRLINCCSNAKNVSVADNIWNNEICDNEIKYDKYILSAYVDCMAKNGLLNESYQFLLDNNIESESGWLSLLSASRKENNKELMEIVYNEIKNRFKSNVSVMESASILLSHFYAASSEFAEMNKIRNEMKVCGWKSINNLAKSEIDINGILHIFTAGAGIDKLFFASNNVEDYSYKLIDKQINEICDKLSDIYGFKHDYSMITRDITDKQIKQNELRRHSEKLAVSYALLETENVYDLVINNSLTVCNDCHHFMKLLSKMKQRNIILSDPNKVHVFVNGECSCNE